MRGHNPNSLAHNPADSKVLSKCLLPVLLLLRICLQWKWTDIIVYYLSNKIMDEFQYFLLSVVYKQSIYCLYNFYIIDE